MNSNSRLALLLAAPAAFIASLIAVVFGLLLYLDDMHDFDPNADVYHVLPDSPFSVYLFGIHFHHLFVGIILIVCGMFFIVMAIVYRMIKS